VGQRRTATTIVTASVSARARRAHVVFDANHPAVRWARPPELTAEFGCTRWLAHHLRPANIAAARRVRLTEFRSTVTGDIDLNGILGLNADVRNSYEKITVRFTIGATLRPGSCARSWSVRARSAVYDVITNGVPVAIEWTPRPQRKRYDSPQTGSRRSPVTACSTSLSIVRSAMHHGACGGSLR
jgi:hypothetical protein